VHTDKGLSGLGEVGMDYGAGAPATAPMVPASGQRFVLGHGPLSTEFIWERKMHNTSVELAR
jgi:L-alanine-DL-glutamate epimerase-like enolase superfamily enzyme